MSSITCSHISVKLNDKLILNDISFNIPEGDSLAIVGASGSGKTTLGKVICGMILPDTGKIEIPIDKVCIMLEQQDNFIAESHLRSGYYGQRYENWGLEEVPTVKMYMQNKVQSFNPEISKNEIESALDQMDMLEFADRKLMMLSSGERKRLQIATALLRNQDVLVLDQPFVGLDIQGREKLEEIINELQNSGKTIVLSCDSEHIPESVNWVLELEKGRVRQFISREVFHASIPRTEDSEKDLHWLHGLQTDKNDSFEFAVKMNNVSVNLGGKEILKNINWTVRKGERWVLTGPNGAGKTTLLSLITADNPQGYINDLMLFDRKRGSGESIWDIKKRIGSVSPELHLYFQRGKGIFNTIPGLISPEGFRGGSISCEDVISSGFHDLIGFSDQPTAIQQKRVESWFSLLQLGHLSKRWFHEASLSEQRLLLLGRALVKMPSLLILDEPCQGLDQQQIRHFNRILDSICTHFSTTLIYVTHYASEIPDSVQYLLQLETGRIKSSGIYQNSE